MANLRLLQIKVQDSTTIQAKFSHELDSFINTSCIVVSSNVPGVPDPAVLTLSIFKQVITITTQPMTPMASYTVTFQSTDSASFKSRDGSAFILEDGQTNAPLVTGPEDPANPVRDFLIDYLADAPYNLGVGDLSRDIINSQATNIARALYDVRQAKNDNYLSVTITDELKTRGPGPFDRLNEEGAYEVYRVGRTPAGSTSSLYFDYEEFPTGPITLLRTDVVGERLVAGEGASTFNGLVLTVANRYVTKLTRLRINYASSGTTEYDISAFGYQILNSRYDQDFASSFLSLENTQFKLSDNVLESSFVLPVAGDTIIVDYEYESKGRIVSEDTVTVTQVLDVVREVTPPILSDFSLANAPIVTADDIIAGTGGVVFLDPEANPPFSTTHPAFTKEIPFKYEALPNGPGEFCIEYSTGRVFVYGGTTNDGTGDYPPVATYKYRKSFSPRLDYTYDPTTSELVANPLRDLADQTVKVSFDYEQVLVPGIDYKAQVHAEVLDERVENRIRSTASVSVLNTPITNVFRVFNETSGEVYKVLRWSDTAIYFSSNTSPRILGEVRERASFGDVLNELLLVNNEFLNTQGTRIFKIILQNNKIMSASEDVIGSSYNSSATFSRTDIFRTELYFDSQILSAVANYNRLLPNQYQIDYLNGVIYAGVAVAQEFDLGTINYKKPVIAPLNTHLISVSEIYNSISNLDGINKRVNYLSFGEGEITPATFDLSDERFLNEDTTLPYLVSGSTITVSDNIKDVRNIYDAYDLNNNTVPTNFAEGATVSASVITLAAAGIQKQELLTVASGFTIVVPFVSAGAELASVVSVMRMNDGVEFGVSSSSSYTIQLSGSGSPVVGDVVLVTYRLRLNGAATPIVDYNRGDYFIDYTYLADEILVSYEYGDNCLDFRESTTIDEKDTYFVSYRVGALRDALLRNFGSLVDIPILNNLDTTLPRERYRDALRGALQTFTKGPTIPAMRELVSHITHIDPEIIESAFQNWALGISRLYPAPINYTGDPQLLSAKFDNGLLISNPDETVTLPISSNLRLEEGTLETWIIPEWDGLDNDATLTFSVMRDGILLPASQIFIGADSHNPTYDKFNKFTVNRMDTVSPIGLPSAIFTNIGLFVYYDDSAKEWKVLAKDQIAGDGYVYSGTIQSSGEVYDVKFLPGLGELSDVLRSGTSKIEFEFHLDGYDVLSPDGYVDGYSVIDGYSPGDGYLSGYSYDGIKFMADDEHYIFDFGLTPTTNRFSLFKDGKGYLNFRVNDRGSKKFNKVNERKVSADISDWSAGDRHFVSIAWKLNTTDHRDEMHLFIDGVEVPNIIRYGGRPISTSSDRFRTVKPEIVAGTVPLKTITARDLTTTAGSPIVISDSVNFSSEGIAPGHTITIKEIGFSTYTILSVGGTSLTLSANMPSSLTSVRYSINQYAVVVSSEVDLSSNIAVSILSGDVETEIPGLRADTPSYEISKNAFNQNVLTILGNADAGDTIIVRTFGLNHRRCRDRQYIWGNTSNVLKTQLPAPINLDEARIYAVMLPSYNVGPSSATLTLGRFITGPLTTSQPSNSAQGRTLAVSMSGGNVDFTIPPTVQINGTTAAGPVFEIVTFTAAGIQNTVNKFKTITSVVIEATPLVTTRNSVSVEIKETYPITTSEGNSLYPVLRYSYKTQTGVNLEGTGNNIVTDNSGFFAASTVEQILVINTPSGVAGTYTITERIDNYNVRVTPTPAMAFTGGSYDVFNISLGRSGFQNGFFVLEQAGGTNIAFPLKQGFYDFDYASYLEIPFDPVSGITGYIGSDMFGDKQVKATLDEFKILSKMLTDVRVGESIGAKEDSVTTDFTSIRPFKPDSDTLVLMHMDSLPLINSADYWITSDKSFLQSANSVNSNFDKSLVIVNRPIVVDNAGLLTTASEGSIEFWVSPRYDTYNDPNFRFYFDANGSIVEEVTSITNGSVKVTGRVSSIVSVRLATDTTSTGPDFFVGGTLESDFQTIKLGKALPYQQTPVKVHYIPSGLSGNRLSIYKDREGYIVFNVRAKKNDEVFDYQVRQPVFWSRDTWHRIRCTYKFNRPDNEDEIRLFVDGEERGTVMFGQGLLFGQSIIFGQGFAGVDNSVLTGDINFTDPINEFSIGSDFLGVNLAQARIDNLRISNSSRTPYTIAGQPRDVNFTSNTEMAFPVVEDAFTTYLLNFDTLISKTTDFALLKDRRFGIFNFTLNIIDSFDIVLSNAKIQQILETLISALKPAQSKVTINYIK